MKKKKKRKKERKEKKSKQEPTFLCFFVFLLLFLDFFKGWVGECVRVCRSFLQSESGVVLLLLLSSFFRSFRYGRGAERW